MDDSNLKSRPFGFEYNPEKDSDVLRDGGESNLREYLIETDNGEVEAALSPVGVNIWDKIDDSPTLRFIKIEDSDHLFLEYWMKTGSKREYHERKGKFIEFPTIRRISSRVHFDDKFIEFRGRKDRERDRKVVRNQIEDLIGSAIFVNEEPIEIDDNTIRYFLDLGEFIYRPHAKKAGTAQSSWSTASRDVTEDNMFPEHRNNEKANMRFNIDSIGKVGFQLSAEDNTFRIFAQKITPQSHIRTVEFIRGKIQEAL